MDHASFVDAARIALDLASSTEVKSGWLEESSCAGMSVGGLAHHLVQQAGNTVRLLEMEPVAEPPIPLLEHYVRAAWVEAGPDEEVNVTIREGADAAAATGPDDVIAHGTAALERLPALLRDHHRRIPDQVRIPWQGWSLTTSDFLVTRAMEIVVHADDLASSVGLETPDFPDDVLADVLALLSAVAVRRHGQVALVRALSRPQRAPEDVSAF